MSPWLALQIYPVTDGSDGAFSDPGSFG